jgi:Family of unknown function (DUF6932)
MKDWPEFNEDGDLPVGVHQATLVEVVEHFGRGNSQRRLVAQRLTRIYDLVISTNRMVRFVVYGSFVTNKPDPNDVDIFLLMEDGFDPAEVTSEADFIFDHMAAHTRGGASVFWTTRWGALGGEQMTIEDWQYKRDDTRRGIIEVISRD